MPFFDKPTGPVLAAGPKRTLVLCLLLVASTLAIYNAVGHAGFVNYDDEAYVTANRHVQAGLQWSTVRWAFTTFEAANWHPLTWLSHALDYEFFQLNPVGHHYTNVLLHCASVVLVFLLLAGSTGRTWTAFIAALLFALHPLNVESVAWVAERKNVLSMFFLLLALWAYQRYARKPSVASYALVALAFACGLMSKPQVITLPFVLLLWDYWPLGRLEFGASKPIDREAGGGRVPIRSLAWLVIEKLPLLALSAASAFITLHAQKAGGAVRSAIEYPVIVRLDNAVCAYLDYVGRLFWPVHLAAMYPHPGASLRGWQIGVATFFVLAVSALVIALQKIREPRRYLAVGWFWFLGTLVPMIGLVQVGQQATADRYMYVPMIGLLIMLCWGLADLAGDHRTYQVGLACLAAVALAALGALTYRQVGFWQNSEALWSHAVAITKGNYVAHVNLGETLVNHGRNAEAAVQFRAAAQIRPSDPAVLLNLATCERREGNYGPALAEDQAVIRLTSDPALRAYALVNLGTDYRHLKDYARARESYTEAIRLKPETARAFIGLGVVAQHTNDFGEAAKNYSRAAELEPSDVAYLLLSQALQQNGQTAAAQVAWEEARKYSADFERAQQAVRDLLAQ